MDKKSSMSQATKQYKKAEQKRLKLMNHQASKPGLRGTINAKCIECIYDPFSEGTWRKQVQDCTSWSCPLFPIRPVTEKKRGNPDE
ncbi:hypothetical protein D5125_17065 [Magnetovirga frankeli]|uniref:hypothetical protein n=1 Tax=Magnetovirga frankeli TaxID=947516 RepID=UPI001292DE87|nr:hypothetical protein D5125_17065 [gamma proteobacterium SS-5]